MKDHRYIFADLLQEDIPFLFGKHEAPFSLSDLIAAVEPNIQTEDDLSR